MPLTYKPKKIVSPTKILRDIPHDKPIIFWDTCMLLYILSITIRNSFGELNYYKQLLAWIENDDVTSVTSSIVWEEFSQHFNEIKTSADDDQDNLKTILRSYADCFPEPSRTAIKDVADSLNIVPILEDIEKRVWEKTYVVNETALLRNLAHFRVLHKMSPSETKDQYKDSLIWVTFLHMAHVMPATLYEVFVTANREDFCTTKRGSQPQQQIVDDCNAANAEFTVQLNTLVNLITRELGNP